MLKFSTALVKALATTLSISLLIFGTTLAQAKTTTQAKKPTATKQVSSKKVAAKTAASKKAASKKSVSVKTASRSKAAKKSTKSVALAKNSSRKFGKSKSKKMAAARAIYIPEKPSVGDLEGLQKTDDPLSLKSNAALVIDQESSQILFEKNSNVSLPIASITKLMTSLVVLEAGQDMNEMLDVTSEDVDTEKNSGSRLRVGSRLSRSDMLHIALMSSENRAASSLGRNYPGGRPAFVAAMNAKAKSLGMTDTHYVDSTGLSSGNVASARDLAKLVKAAYEQPIIRQYSTDTKYAVEPGGRQLQYISSNKLTSNSDWEIGLQKTGYISEAGRCLVMQAMIKGRAVVMVFLDSKGKYSRFADAGRIRNWLEKLQPSAAKPTL